MNLPYAPNKKVLYIVPELNDIFPNSVEDAKEVDVVHPPLGVLYIASYCEKYGGYIPLFLDAMIEGKNMVVEMIKSIEENEINVVCLTAMTANYEKAVLYATAAKERGCIVIIGGQHISGNYLDVMLSGKFNFGIVGEGEKTTLDLLNAINGNMPVSDIKGIVYKNLGKVKYTGLPERISNLDIIPFPAYEHFDMDRYIDLQALGIVTSRGCPNNCAFCSSKCIWGRQVTYRSIDNIIDELKFLCEKFDYYGKEINIYDDNFALNHKRVKEFCDKLRINNLNISWKCMSRVDTVNEDILKHMKRAGCYKISFGIESSNEETLRKINKGITLKQIENAIHLCESVGIKFHGYFMIGFPWEKKEDFLDTIRFIEVHKEIESSLSILTPYPGTDFYDNKEKWGIEISDNWRKYNHITPIMRSANYSYEDIMYAYSYYIFLQQRKLKHQ